MERDPEKCHFYESMSNGFHRYVSVLKDDKFIGFARKSGKPINFNNTKRKYDEKCFNLFKDSVEADVDENNNLGDISSNIKKHNGGNGSNNNSNKESNKKSMPANIQSNDVDVMMPQHPIRHQNHHRAQQQQKNYEVSANGNIFKKKTQYSTISSTSERPTGRKSSLNTRKQHTKKHHLTNANKKQFQKHEERDDRDRPNPTNNNADYPLVKPKLTKKQVHQHVVRTPDQRRRATSTSTVDYY